MIEVDINKLLDGLNEVQRQIVQDTEGQILVLAGAGSGKTRVLTHRIAYLLDLGVPEHNILAVTFTKKAAREMRERVTQLVGSKGKEVWIGTFHSICMKLLSQYGKEIGYEKFTLIDDKDQKKIIKELLDLMGYEFKAEKVLHYISRCKNQLITAEVALGQAQKPPSKDFANLYYAYEEKKKELNYLDFDDLIMKTVHLMNVSVKARDRIQKRFKYIMVDEYQDTNHAQFKLIDLFSRHHENIFVVGDADQSIYRFRGAEISNILNFQSTYPFSKVYKLERNYRSTQTIVNASNHLIQNNTERLDKTAYSEGKVGDPIVIYQADDESREADFVTAVIKRMVELENRPYKDFAVLYRTNRQSRQLESSFFQAGIPYTILKGLTFYERKEIKDTLAYLRVIHNPDDDLAWRRIINVPKRGIGDTTIEKIQDYADKCRISFGKALRNIEDVPKVSGKAKNSIREFLQLIDEFVSYTASEDFLLPELIKQVVYRTGYMQTLNPRKNEDLSRIENIHELINVAGKMQEEKGEEKLTLNEFLSESALTTEVDELDGEKDAVTLMTIHSSKGLEFNCVFVVGMEESIFPHNRAAGDPVELEEERRLGYVAFTRAAEKLFLTHCRTRYEYGSGPTFNKPSRFLDELPDELVKRI